MTAAATIMPPPRGAPPRPPSATSPPVAGNGNHTTTPATGFILGAVVATHEPERIGLNAVEGFGKSTIAAYMPNPVILMAKGETGYRTLLARGLVPQCDGAVIESWPQALAAIDHLIANDTGHESIALDAGGGFERLCHEHVCVRDFRGDFGEKGFLSYNKGPELAVNDWLQLLARLDRLREVRKMRVLILGHVKVKTFKNPLGEDFDRYIVDMHEKTWAVTAKWLDAVFFGNFVSVIEKDRPTARKGKGIGGQERVIYTQHHDAYDAKNRYGLPSEIDIPSDPAQAWNTIYTAMNGAQP